MAFQLGKEHNTQENNFRPLCVTVI